MTTEQSAAPGYTPESEHEISLLDIVNFLQSTWKTLSAASIVGAALGLAGWFFLGTYSAQLTLLNSGAMELVSWRTIQKSLPSLASQIVEDQKAPEGAQDQFIKMEDPDWWPKNITPTYALTKADTKDMASISKDLDSASTTILNLNIEASGPSKQAALQNVQAAAAFIRTGGAYLQIKNLLNGMQVQTISEVAQLQKKMTDTQIELDYQQKRAQSLEELHKRFPSTASVTQQVVDPKDSGAKYLPLTTQIIAVNNDINASKEALERQQKSLAQLTLTQAFWEQAAPLADKTYDGLALTKQLLAIEQGMRAKSPKDDANATAFFDDLHFALAQIQARFTNELEVNTAPVAKKRGMLKATAGGLFAAFFLMLLVLLGQRVWQTVKSGAAK